MAVIHQLKEVWSFKRFHFAFGVRAVPGGPEGLDVDQWCYYSVLGTGSSNSTLAPCALLQLRNSTHQ